MNLRGRTKAEEPERLDEMNLCPLSVLWLVNNSGHGGNSDYSNKFIMAILSAEISLYYMNENFDRENAFKEYRLTDNAIAEACMQVGNAEYDIPDTRPANYWSDCFSRSLCDQAHLIDQTVPLWFGTIIPIRLAHASLMKTDDAVGIESLFVKVLDVKSVCLLQGIENFFWPTEYPLLHPGRFVEYKLINGTWRRLSVNRKKARIGQVSKSELLNDQRIACVVTALKKHHFVSIESTVDNSKPRRPSVKQIYRWVSGELPFSKHGKAGFEPISILTFNQLWKKKLRVQVYAQIDNQA